MRTVTVRDRAHRRLLGWAVPAIVEPVLRTPFLTTCRWLETFESWPREQRRAWQEARLREVLDHATTTVPFYRALAGRSGTRLHLADLPSVSKADIRADQPQFLATDSSDIPHVSKRTGGTTGDPWAYPLDRHAWAVMYASRLRFLESTGYRYGDRVAVLGSPASLVGGGRSASARLRRLVEHQVIATTETDIDHVSSLARARRVERLDARMWYGYAGTMAAMADAVLAEGISIAGPTAIVTTAETLRPEWRQRILAAFGTPVHDQYGCNDGGLISQSCPAGSFHLAEALSIVEVLDADGAPVPSGEEGEVAVTNLHQRSLPFLRYRIGDRGTLAARCRCGHDGPVITELRGREWDRLHLPDGRVLGPLAFYPLFADAPDVNRWQLAQVAVDRVDVRLEVAAPHALASDVLQRIHGYVVDQCGPGVRVRVTTTEPVVRTAGGKLRAVCGLGSAEA